MIRFNSTTNASITYIYCNEYSSDSTSASISEWLEDLGSGDQQVDIRIVENGVPSNFIILRTGLSQWLEGAAGVANEFAIPCVHVASTGTSVPFSADDIVTCSFAAVGQKGATGGTGPTGSKGQKGESGGGGGGGSKGQKGQKGAGGSTGSTGPTGGTGPTGSKGQKGATGAAGPQGSAGSTGPSGAKGATGAAGPQGSAGSTGGKGQKGEAGGGGGGDTFTAGTDDDLDIATDWVANPFTGAVMAIGSVHLNITDGTIMSYS
jgi:hypothetical protein